MTTYEKIPEIIKLNNIVNWKIRKSKSDANSFLFFSDDEKSVDANIEDMNRLFTWEFGDFYILDGSRHTSKAAGTGRLYFEFSNKRERSDTAPQPQPMVHVGATATGISEDELNRKIELATREIESRYKAEALKEERKAFEDERKQFYSERDSGLNLVLSKIGSVLLPLLGNAPAVAVQGISGVEQEANIRITPTDDVDAGEYDDTATALLNEWLSIDGEALELLTKIVSIAKSNPTMYNMAKGLLKSQ